jgi:hypothetical protein
MINKDCCFFCGRYRDLKFLNNIIINGKLKAKFCDVSEDDVCRKEVLRYFNGKNISITNNIK